MRYKNVEFIRAGVVDSNGYTIESASTRPPEIVAWQKAPEEFDREETCYTLCWFKEDKEGFYIETIGNRFTEYEDTEALMHVAKYALRALDNEKDFKEYQ